MSAAGRRADGEAPLTLSVTNHDRDAVGMRYVYAVVSRRTGGVSLGVNLSPNNACNWRCVYCQVPELIRGASPAIDLGLLERELSEMLVDIVHGDFLARRAPVGARRLSDVALSGNGEPTSSPDFAAVVELVGGMLRELDLPDVKTIVISNGSLVGRPAVARGLRLLSQLGGELWFKLDSATVDGIEHVNGVPLDPRSHVNRLRRAAQLCPTWIQTCVFTWDDQVPDPTEIDAYLDCLRSLVRDQVPLEGVMLYGLARPSLQPEAGRLGPPPAPWMHALAASIEDAGLAVMLAER